MLNFNRKSSVDSLLQQVTRQFKERREIQICSESRPSLCYGDNADEESVCLSVCLSGNRWISAVGSARSGGGGAGANSALSSRRSPLAATGRERGGILVTLHYSTYNTATFLFPPSSFPSSLSLQGAALDLSARFPLIGMFRCLARLLRPFCQIPIGAE